jgi:molecular chaperone HtpG
MLDKLADDKEKYQSFWNEFGQVLKEGPAEDFSNKEKVAKLLRFASTHTDEATQNVSFDEYIERMKEGQEKIYYITADSFNAAKNSPHLEIFRKKGIEVFLMYDRIDEWLLSHLNEFAGKQLVSVTKGDLDLGDLEDAETKAQKEQQETEFASFLERAKTSLGDKVADVRLTHRLTGSPSCIVAGAHDMSSQMVKLMQSVGQAVPEQKPVFELNPEHAMVKHVADIQDEESFTQWVNLLLE